MPCPGWTLEMSTSVVDSASTSADGAIWTNRGASATTAPIPAKETAATFRKSRRRTPSSSVGPAVCGTSADLALVAIIPLLTRFDCTCRKASEQVHSERMPGRLAGLIARGSGSVKGAESLFRRPQRGPFELYPAHQGALVRLRIASLSGVPQAPRRSRIALHRRPAVLAAGFLAI